MSPTEFDEYRRRLISEYASEHVRVGNWNAEQAEQLAAAQIDELLGEGVDTQGSVLRVGERAGQIVGRIWAGMMPAPLGGWWLFDIEVVPECRRRGLGRVLLEAAEQEVRSRGGDSVGLNVFSGNAAALRLYETQGYEVTSIRMRKRLAP